MTATDLTLLRSQTVRFCSPQWSRLKQCMTRSACTCLETDESLLSELYETFQSNLVETAAPTAVPKPSGSPTVTAVPTLSFPPTRLWMEEPNEPFFEFEDERRLSSEHDGSIEGSQTRARQIAQQQRLLQEEEELFLDGAQDDYFGGTLVPMPTRPPTNSPHPTTSTQPTLHPTTATPTDAPTDDPRIELLCPDPSKAVCARVNSYECCCSREIHALAGCAVGRVFPDLVGLRRLSCGHVYATACDAGSSRVDDGSSSAVDLLVEDASSSDMDTTQVMLLAVLLPVMVALMLLFLSYFHYKNYSAAQRPWMLRKPVTTKETHVGGGTVVLDNNGNSNHPSPSSICQLDYCVSSMQGWRKHMEDRHLMVSLSPHTSLFAVFDGHGGDSSSEFLYQSLVDTLQRQESFQQYTNSCEHYHQSNNSNESSQTVSPQQQQRWLKLALEQTCIDLEYQLLQHLKEMKQKKRREDKAKLQLLLNKKAKAKKPLAEQVQELGFKKDKNTSKDQKGCDANDSDDPRFDEEEQEASGKKNSDNISSEHHITHDTIFESGSTAIIVLVTPQWIVCANVGDSRSVLAVSSTSADPPGNLPTKAPSIVHAIPLSTDHKPLDPEEEKRISELGGEITGRKKTKHGVRGSNHQTPRINGVLAVSRAFGDFQLKDYSPLNQWEKGDTIIQRQVVSPIPQIMFQPHSLLAQQPAPNGNNVNDEHDHKPLFVVLACDGIWDVMSSEECIERFHQVFRDDPSLSLSAACERVLDECLDKGSKDNMTLMIVRFSDSESHSHTA